MTAYSAVMAAEVDFATRLVFQCFNRVSPPGERILSSVKVEFLPDAITVVFCLDDGSVAETWLYKSGGEVEAFNELAIPTNAATWSEAMKNPPALKSKLVDRLLAYLTHVSCDVSVRRWRGTLDLSFAPVASTGEPPSDAARRHVIRSVEIRDAGCSIEMSWKHAEVSPTSDAESGE